MTLLRVKNLSTRGTTDVVLKSITFSQKKLEKIAVAGETGAGKSTLLRTIAGLVQPEEGELSFEGKPIVGPDYRLVPGQPGVAYLSQHFELPKFLRVEQVLEYANVLSDDQAEELFRVCQIDHLMSRGTDQLSGGERQRVAIARLLISAPRLLLLDEPFSHLDREHKDTLKEVVKNIGDLLGITLILVSHDPQDTLPWADRILVMRDGRIIQAGTPEEIYFQPVDRYVGGLFGAFNIIAPSDFHLLAPYVSMKRLRESGGGKALFFRPEQWHLVPESGRAIRCRVDRVWFMGSHWEARIALGDSTYHLRSAEPLEEGQTCFLAFRKDHLWFV